MLSFASNWLSTSAAERMGGFGAPCAGKVIIKKVVAQDKDLQREAASATRKADLWEQRYREKVAELHAKYREALDKKNAAIEKLKAARDKYVNLWRNRNK